MIFLLPEVINYPTGDWTPANLNCLKTESFTYTGERNLDLSLHVDEFREQPGLYAFTAQSFGRCQRFVHSRG